MVQNEKLLWASSDYPEKTRDTSYNWMQQRARAPCLDGAEAFASQLTVTKI